MSVPETNSNIRAFTTFVTLSCQKLKRTFEGDYYKRNIRARVDSIARTVIIAIVGLYASPAIFIGGSIVSFGLFLASETTETIVRLVKKTWESSGLSEQAFHMMHLPLYAQFPIITCLLLAVEVGYYSAKRINEPNPAVSTTENTRPTLLIDPIKCSTLITE